MQTASNGMIGSKFSTGFLATNQKIQVSSGFSLAFYKVYKSQSSCCQQKYSDNITYKNVEGLTSLNLSIIRFYDFYFFWDF